MSTAGFVIALLGIGLLVVAAIGLFRLPDALARQHAATKSTTLALALILIGAAIHAPEEGWWWRVSALLLLLLATLPVASHMLARAAARRVYGEDALRETALVDGDS
jgi:multicomponent Na+:H+ antiporter subunit G